MIMTMCRSVDGRRIGAEMKFVQKSGSTPLKEGLAAYERDDYSTALKVLRPMAINGEAIAQVVLGAMYITGRGVPEDRAEGIRWYRKAADQGHANAQNVLGDIFRSEGDDFVAQQWYRRAAEQGHAEAQFSLGNSYGYPGEDSQLKEDQDESIMWIRKAADQGHSDAQYTLALVLEGKAKYSESAKWYRRAADRGHTDAQYKLGRMYETGSGVQRDVVRACKWFILAALSRDPAAIADRGSIAAYMTTAEIAEAKRLAREWKPK
jgi:TPR repeat protein